ISYHTLLTPAFFPYTTLFRSCNASTEGWRTSALKLLLTFPRRELSKRVMLNVPISDHVLKRLQLPRSRVIYHGVPDPLNHREAPDRKSTRLNSSHVSISYAVF